MSASGASFGFDRNSAFESTRWSVVIRARGPEASRESREALNYLCRTYWYPLFAYARRQGSAPHDAQDLTQGFFAYLLQQNLFSGADPKRGRLRTFLLTAFSRYMTREWHRIHAQKRGGHQVIESLDEEFAEGEHRYCHEAVEQMTPEQLFARSWSQSVLDTALEMVRSRENAAGRKELFRKTGAVSPSRSRSRRNLFPGGSRTWNVGASGASDGASTERKVSPSRAGPNCRYAGKRFGKRD